MGQELGAVERDDLGAAVGKFHGEEAAAEAEAVAGEVGVELDLEDLDFEDVAGFGFCDGDGAGEDVAAGTLVGDLGVDGRGVGRDLLGPDAFGDHALGGAAGGERLDRDDIAAMNREDGFALATVVSPGDGGWGGEQGEVCCAGSGAEGEQGAERKQAADWLL